MTLGLILGRAGGLQARRTCSSSLAAITASSLPRLYYSSSHSHGDKGGQTGGDDSHTTHFGFRQVFEAEKERLVGKVFRDVATKYDMMNDLMSLGIHRCWKDTFVARLQPQPGMQILDSAGGTGDIAFRILEAIEQEERLIHSRSCEKETRVIVADINPDMLAVGQGRAKTRLSMRQQDRITWREANAEDLGSLEDVAPAGSLDAYTIAFGIRNCTHPDRVLAEAYRVLKPGGRFLCMEFSPMSQEAPLSSSPLSTVAHRAFAAAYDAYSFHVIPRLGGLVSGHQDAYQYFVESIRQFPDTRTFAAMLEQAGFRAVTVERLTGGIAAIHSGFKL